MVLVGPSGCGKTTLLRSIGGLEPITRGTIRIGERDVTKLAPARRDVAMVFQNYALYPHMTVRKNLGYGLRVRKTPRKEAAERIDRVARLLGLAGPARPPARPALRRPAAAGGDGPRDRPRAGGVPDGRAALEPGREAPRRHANVLAAAARPPRDDDDLRHARPGRGDDAGPARRRDAGRQDPAGRPAAAALRGPGEPLRRRLHRLAGDEPDRDRRGRRRRSASAGTRSRSTASAGRSFASEGKAIVGIRPEAFEDAAFAASGLPQIDVRVEVIEELGSDALRLLRARREAGRRRGSSLGTRTARTASCSRRATTPLFAARVDARTKARVGETIRLARRPLAALLLLAGDGREPAARTRRSPPA